MNAAAPTAQRVSIKFWLVLALVSAMVALAAWYGLQAAWADSSTLRARWVVSQWREGKGPARSVELLLRTSNDLLAGTRITPGDPQLYDDLGFINASQAEALTPFMADEFIGNYRQTLLVQAAGYYRTSTTLRPTYPYSWVYLALAKQLLDQRDDEFWQAYDNAFNLGHAEAGVQKPLAQMAFRDWKTLNADRKAQILSMVKTAQPQVSESLWDIAASMGVDLEPQS